MGILSRLFGKKHIESLKEFEAELIKLKSKNYCEMTALIGTTGRLKGLPLIYASENEEDLKVYTAKLIELLFPLNILAQNESINRFILYYGDYILIFKPITSHVGFFALTKQTNYILTLQRWINKKSSILENLFSEKE